MEEREVLRIAQVAPLSDVDSADRERNLLEASLPFSPRLFCGSSG